MNVAAIASAFATVFLSVAPMLAPPATPDPPPIPEAVFLQVPYHSQVTETALPNACGPAALLMVLDYLGLESSLDGVIQRAQSIPVAEGGYDASCSANPVCTSPATLARVANGYGLAMDSRDGWALRDVQESLTSGRPVIADITWSREGAVGHFVVIYGLDTERQEVYYHDPYNGAARTAGWAEFAASWNNTVDVGDPLQPEGHQGNGITIR